MSNKVVGLIWSGEIFQLGSKLQKLDANANVVLIMCSKSARDWKPECLNTVTGNLAQILFGFITGAVIRYLSYAQAMLTAMCMFALSFLHAVLFLKQTSPAQKKANSAGVVFNCNLEGIAKVQSANSLSDMNAKLNNESAQAAAAAAIKATKSKKTYREVLKDALQSVTILVSETKQALTRKRDGHLRAYIWITVLCFFVLNCCQMGLGIIINIFCMAPPIEWNVSDIAFYNAFNNIIQLVGTLFGTCILKQLLKFHESSILLVTVVSSFLRCLFTGLATNATMLYVASALGVFGNMTFCIAKSMSAQFVQQNDIGKIYSLYQMATDSSVVFTFTAMTGIYASTASFYSGFVFLFMAF